MKKGDVGTRSEVVRIRKTQKWRERELEGKKGSKNENRPEEERKNRKYRGKNKKEKNRREGREHSLEEGSMGREKWKNKEKLVWRGRDGEREEQK